MGALLSLSKSATVICQYIALGAVVGFGLLFLLAWIAEEFSDRWKAYRKVLIITAIVGCLGEQLFTITEFALSEHLQAISDEEVTRVTTQLSWRALNEKNFLSLLKGKPSELTVHVWYKPEDEEAKRFAQQIWNALAGALGWKERLQEIRSIPSDSGYDSLVEVTMRCWQEPPNMSAQDRAAFFALQYALVHSQGDRHVGMAAHGDSSLPEGNCRVVIGQEGGKL